MLRDGTNIARGGLASSYWLTCGLLMGMAACTTGRDLGVSARPPPVTVDVTPAQAYAPEVPSSNEDPADVCALDPATCPRLDFLASTRTPTAASLSSGGGDTGPEILLTGPLAGASAVSRRSGSLTSRVYRGIARAESKVLGQARRGAPEPVRTNGKPDALELREIEVHLMLEVDDISRAVERVHALVATFGGQVIHEVFEDSASQHGAALSIRAPAEKTTGFLAKVSDVGRVRSRKVQSQDISRKYLDAEILLKNLRATLARYQELLARADTVTEVAGIEASLARLRTQLERVEGDLRWLADLGARSTIYLKLSSAEPEQYSSAPEAKLWPGLRGSLLFDLGSDAEPNSFGGGGLAFSFQRSFGFDVALMHDLGDDDINVFYASIGGEVYSDYLGGGRRRWLNPYLGFRGAYLHHQGLHEAALGATVGIELWRSDMLLFDIQARGYAAFASELGLHALLEPGLGLHMAF